MIDTTFEQEIARLRSEHAYPAGYRQWPDRYACRALGVLFPHFWSESAGATVVDELAALRELLVYGLDAIPDRLPQDSAALAAAHLDGLPEIRQALWEDATAIYDGDPAAESVGQVLFCYPGFYAIAIHRLSHSLYRLAVPLLPRMLSEHAHRFSGVDIHPGATIGRHFFIDHGTGIVVGETAVIGDRVKLYQGVTLGAHQVHKRLAGAKRHPTLEDGVVVYAHATILGDIVIGSQTVVGGNTWITRDVAPNSVVSSRNVVKQVSDSQHIEVSDFSI